MKVDFELENEICKAADNICYEELRFIEDELEQHGKFVFSSNYNKKIERTIYGKHELNKNGFLKNDMKGKRIKYKYVLLVAILLVLCASTAMAVEPIREKLVLTFYTVFPDNIEIYKEEELENAQNEKMVINKPTYVPDGYEVYEERINEEMRRCTITWVDNEERMLYYSQFDVNDRNISVTSNGTKPETVYANGHEAKMVVDENGTMALFYEADNYIYMISGELTKNELVKILESID